MENTVFLGVITVIAGALLGGTFVLPSKFAKGYPWEVLWGGFFLFATIVLPATLVLIWHEPLFATWSQSSWSQLMPALCFGFLWGLGSFVSGLAFATAGLSLGYAITMGMQTSFGSTVPLVFGSAEGLSPTVISLVVAGIIVCLIGVVLTGYAGILKERTAGSTTGIAGQKPLVRRGILLAIAGGILAACLNYSFSFSQPVLDIAKQQFDGDAAKATLAVWVPALVGGSISSLGYCVYLLIKNRRDAAPAGRPLTKVLGIALLMAILHDGAIFLYGRGSDFLGKLGPTIGFAIFASGMMLIGNLNGYLTKEWKGTAGKTRMILFAGLASIVAGILLLAYSNSLKEN